MTGDEIKDMVKGWAWNLSIWEIYDLLKQDGELDCYYHYKDEERERIQSRALSYGCEYFNNKNSKQLFEDMGEFFGVGVFPTLEGADKWYEKEDKEMEELV